MTLEEFLRDMHTAQRELTVPHKAEVALRIEQGKIIMRIKPANQEGAEFTDFDVNGNHVEPR